MVFSPTIFFLCYSLKLLYDRRYIMKIKFLSNFLTAYLCVSFFTKNLSANTVEHVFQVYRLAIFFFSTKGICTGWSTIIELSKTWLSALSIFAVLYYSLVCLVSESFYSEIFSKRVCVPTLLLEQKSKIWVQCMTRIHLISQGTFQILIKLVPSSKISQSVVGRHTNWWS